MAIKLIFCMIRAKRLLAEYNSVLEDQILLENTQIRMRTINSNPISKTGIRS
jgi:hypothetical protein